MHKFCNAPCNHYSGQCRVKKKMAEYKWEGQFDYEGLVWTSFQRSPTLLDGVRQLKFSQEDIIIASYPKSGTTWMRYITYLIQNNGSAPGDKDLLLVLPHLESINPGQSEDTLLKEYAEMPSPRLFSTHLSSKFLRTQILEDRAKFIIVMRNPKDTLVSYYYYHTVNRYLGPFKGSWDEFFELYKRNELYYGDSIDTNVEWWKLRENGNILIVKYEEMKENLEAVVRKVVAFMGRDLDEEAIARTVHLASFPQMKNDSKATFKSLEDAGVYDFSKSDFMRKGVVGDWKNRMSPEQSAYIDGLCETKCKPLGLVFQE